MNVRTLCFSSVWKRPPTVIRSFPARGWLHFVVLRDAAPRAIPLYPLRKHASQYRNVGVHVIVYADLAFAVVRPVEPPDELLKRAAPGDGNGEKQRVQPCVVEPLARVPPGGDNRPSLRLRDGLHLFIDNGAPLLAHAAVHHDDVRGILAKLCGQEVQMFLPLGQDHWRPSVLKGVVPEYSFLSLAKDLDSLFLTSLRFA